MSASQKSSGLPALPSGYRLVTFASDKWILVAPGGLWVASYQGGLNLWKAALDARAHHQDRE